MKYYKVSTPAKRLLSAVCAVLLIISMASETSSAGLDSSVCVGSTVQFGNYHNYAINWTVLAVENGRALLVSTLALDVQPYNSGSTAQSTTWENCSLRTWLNGSFFSEAFSKTEQAAILTVTLDNPGYTNSNGQYIDGGNSTKDQVFLLSMDEVKTYFSSDSARKADYTSYASSQGASAYDSYGACYWWLRSPGLTQDRAACVDVLGYPYRDGSYVNYTCAAVRPAMWVQLGTAGESNAAETKTEESISNKTESSETTVVKTNTSLPDPGAFLQCGVYESGSLSKYGNGKFVGYRFDLDNGKQAAAEYLELMRNWSDALMETDYNHLDYTSTSAQVYDDYFFTYSGTETVGTVFDWTGLSGNLYITISYHYIDGATHLTLYYGDGFTLIDSGQRASVQVDDYSGNPVSSDSDSSGSSSNSGSEKAKVQCPKCNGTKEVTCSQCNGRGTETRYVSVPNYSGHSNTSGSVEVTCSKCHGNKTVDCPRCHGEGKI